MSVNTFENFKKAFKDYTDYYVLIGGTATSIILDANGLKARTTKDYDLVLLDDKKDEAFYGVLTHFLISGNYVMGSLDEQKQLFRFETDNTDYPKEIELFSKKPNFNLEGIGRIVPFVFEPSLSLSAILLDTPYYDFLCDNKEIINGYSVLSNVDLIVLKAKAWVDLFTRKEQGEFIPSTNVKKHLNDVTRLTATLIGDEALVLPSLIKKEMMDFLNLLEENIDLIPQNKDIALSQEEVLEILRGLLMY